MLENKKILIGITGCIGVYKICYLVNSLKKNKVTIKIIMTEAATKFVTPLTFQSLSNSPVYLDTFDTINKESIEHILLADWCDIALIAPATANTIAKISNGLADNLLTTVICAIPDQIPILIAPAMNSHMWSNPINQKNISTLVNIEINGKRKYNIVEPRYGKLACGYEGKGALADPEVIISALDELL